MVISYLDPDGKGGGMWSSGLFIRLQASRVEFVRKRDTSSELSTFRKYKLRSIYIYIYMYI